jgi:hypothetical protein
MGWIALAIVLYIAGYTVVTLRYRKPGPEFQPYAQALERAALAKAGFSRIPARVERPADPRFGAPPEGLAAAAGGLPPALLAALPGQAPLPVEIGKIAAASEANRYLVYTVQFTCVLPDNRRELGGAEIFLRGGELFIVPDLVRLPGALLTRTRENAILLTVPAGAIPAGGYRATLVGERSSKEWRLEVR